MEKREIDDGEFNFPQDIAFDPAGTKVYVADRNNHRIQVFDSENNHQMTFGEKGVDDGEFDIPSAITVNPTDGTIYVADTHNHRIQVFDSDE